jgi:hypothetical protein
MVMLDQVRLGSKRVKVAVMVLAARMQREPVERAVLVGMVDWLNGVLLVVLGAVRVAMRVPVVMAAQV